MVHKQRTVWGGMDNGECGLKMNRSSTSRDDDNMIHVYRSFISVLLIF